MLVVLAISIGITILRFGVGVLEDQFVSQLNTTYGSSAEFLAFYALLNLYLFTMAWVYAPADRPIFGNFLPIFEIVTKSIITLMANGTWQTCG